MNYVVHYCKNPECNNCWIDKDVTNVKTYPPTWKYCEECCKKLGIDFNNQSVELSEKQQEAIDKMLKHRKY
jgi:hypothetical protein